MVYIYSNHLGGLYVSDEDFDCDELFCETCGDCDILELASDNEWEIRRFLRDQLDFLGLGGYDAGYLEGIMKQCMDILG